MTQAWLVTGDHCTKLPTTITYSSVVSMNSARIYLLITALNDIDILCADIQNTYLSTINKGEIWCHTEKEFGTEAGQRIIVTKDLYGIKYVGASFRSFLALNLDDMNFVP